MRIIGGAFRGYRIPVPATRQVRPTQDKVKESIFNILGKRISGTTVLDGFCGSGSLGLEAVSRGAASVVFVDTHTRAISQTLVRLKAAFPDFFEDNAAPNLKIVEDRFQQYCRKTRLKFDLVFLDPPWTVPELFLASLKAIIDFDILVPQGMIIGEHPGRDTLPSGPFEIVTERTYGNTRISFLKPRASETVEKTRKS